MLLNITEIFASVQGETSLSGLPTTFIRLSGCNLRCSWCDTPYSFPKGLAQDIESLIQKTIDFGCPYVCVTGGEPLLQSNVLILLKQLCDKNFIVSLETGGSLTTTHVDARVKIILDIKCPGSKMEHKNYFENLHLITTKDEVKFVILDEKDYIYAKDVCERYSLIDKTSHLLFSPVHGQLNPQTLVNWILRDKLPVRLNMQMHKYIWSPSTRGV